MAKLIQITESAGAGSSEPKVITINADKIVKVEDSPARGKSRIIMDDESYYFVEESQIEIIEKTV